MGPTAQDSRSLAFCWPSAAACRLQQSTAEHSPPPPQTSTPHSADDGMRIPNLSRTKDSPQQGIKGRVLRPAPSIPQNGRHNAMVIFRIMGQDFCSKLADQVLCGPLTEPPPHTPLFQRVPLEFRGANFLITDPSERQHPNPNPDPMATPTKFPGQCHIHPCRKSHW